MRWKNLLVAAVAASVFMMPTALFQAGAARRAHRSPQKQDAHKKTTAGGRSGKSDTSNGPNPRLTPAQVVQAQMNALQHNDTPHPDSGIATTFRYASPQNRRMTGPLPHFIRIVKTPAYLPMLNFKAATYGKAVVRGDRATVRVQIISARNQRLAYVFVLSRQTDSVYKGCWLTDAVASDTRPINLKDL